MNANTATEKQISFINSLKTQRDITGIDATRALVLGRELWKIGKFDTKAASFVIDALKVAPYQAKDASPVEVPEGMHRLADGTIYKVQVAVHGSGRLYAKRLQQFQGGWQFNRAPGAMRLLSPATKMSLEQAKEFGALYGTCCSCGRTLTDENSIAAGIGPVCAKRF